MVKMRSSRDRRGKTSTRSNAWDDWQRYLKKETQRIKQKSSGNVVELKLVEPELPPPPAAQTNSEKSGHMRPGDVFEARQPPVPGVPREEAIQVSDNQIGKTVQPFTYQDYRGIRPLTSPDIFGSSQAGPDSTRSEIVTEQDIPTTAPKAIKIGSTVEVIPEPKIEGAKSQTGTKQKIPGDGKIKDKMKAGQGGTEPGLFDSVSEHSTIARQRFTRKSKLDREELIEKLLDPIISLEEAATLIGVCKTTVRRYTNKGDLDCLRTPGSQRRFKLSQVLDFVKKRETSQRSRRGRKIKM